MTGIALYVVAMQQNSAKNEVKIEVKGDYRYISSNGIPDHKTGQFPGKGNPNAISPQKYNFRIPLNPKIAEKTTELRMQDFGVALNGVPFDPGTAEYWNNDRSSGWHWEGIINGVAYLGIDFNNAHVQPNGAYHYHAIPVDLMKRLGGDGSKMVHVGWAADGFPMYGTYGYNKSDDEKSGVKKMKSSYRLKPGTRPSGPGGAYDGSFEQDWQFIKDSGDLDECNGRFGVTPEFPKGTYYYVVSEAYPWIPRLYRGTKDPSFRKGPGGPGGPGGRPGGPPPNGGGEK